MAQGGSIIEDVKHRVSLSSVVAPVVELRASGDGLIGLCPFHQEKTPSFHVRDKVGRFKCFGCGASGDAIEFIMRLRGITFADALKELAFKAGITQGTSFNNKNKKSATINEEARLLNVQKVAQHYFMSQLHKERSAEAARHYLLNTRKLNLNMIKQINLGFGGTNTSDFFTYLKNAQITKSDALKAGIVKEGKFGLQPQFLGRITFPIMNWLGEIVAFGARKLEEEDSAAPKYVNTHAYLLYEKRKNFYGLFESKKAILQGQALYIVEGYFDALALWAVGAPAIALCGTALSLEHVNKLKSLCSKVVLFYDADDAGINALRTSLPLLFQHNIKAQVVVSPKKDPGSYLDSNDLASLRALIDKKRDAFCYLIDMASHSSIGQDVGGRLNEIDNLLPIFSSIPRQLEKRQYAAYFASVMHEEASVIWKEISKKPPTKKVLLNNTEQKKVIHLSSYEKMLSQVFLIKPILIFELDIDHLPGLSPEFLQFISLSQKNITKESCDIKRLQEIAKSISEKFYLALQEALIEPLIMEEGVAIEVLSSIKQKLQESKTKLLVRKKRADIHQAQINKDFDTVLKSLKEQSNLLPKKSLARLPESKKAIKNKALDEEIAIFEDDNNWF